MHNNSFDLESLHLIDYESPFMPMYTDLPHSGSPFDKCIHIAIFLLMEMASPI